MPLHTYRLVVAAPDGARFLVTVSRDWIQDRTSTAAVLGPHFVPLPQPDCGYGSVKTAVWYARKRFAGRTIFVQRSADKAIVRRVTRS